MCEVKCSILKSANLKAKSPLFSMVYYGIVNSCRAKHYYDSCSWLLCDVSDKNQPTPHGKRYWQHNRLEGEDTKVCVCVYVFVREREIQIERERDILCFCARLAKEICNVCVCVWERKLFSVCFVEASENMTCDIKHWVENKTLPIKNLPLL